MTAIELMRREYQIQLSRRRDSATSSVRDSLERRVLVIDDNVDSLTLIKTILEMEDYLVSTANGGRVALKILAEGETPDLILLDVQMEGMSGLQFLSVLAEQQSDILDEVPVVFLTGMSEAPVSRAVGFIRKPIMIDSFLIETRRFIDDSRRHQVSRGSLKPTSSQDRK
jgi:CheY-like chemotaxis protein